MSPSRMSRCRKESKSRARFPPGPADGQGGGVDFQIYGGTPFREPPFISFSSEVGVPQFKQFALQKAFLFAHCC
ncbi:hypothetical protein NITGR_170053 [Nitrospina gracilis 3/211]|uniref:Uncharacterized protein n=1 Tax=Nitrospina gracilis (strain 3/211) TaxID=1266370 RepID=M1Z9F7_NITG3|nr:hypothetical protein NITGR_170053 [Nitrospina gracilis 3/211]